MSLITTRYGKFNIIDTDSVISGSLRLYGEWAQHEIDLLAYFIQPGSVVVDAGAFIGTHARAFSALVGATGKVLAFEPRQATAAVLMENSTLSPIANIRVISSALGSAENSVTVPILHFDTNANFGASTLEPLRSQNFVGEKVVITPLDFYTLDRLDFIKIDVEGMELDVLNGAKETVEQYRPIIFAECNSLEASVSLIKWCQEHNYQIYGVLSPAYNEHNFAGNPENVFGPAQETGMLFIPIESCSKFEEIISKQNLPPIKTADDLVLLLLHKPQYPYEVLAHTATASALSLEYSSPQADKLIQALTSSNQAVKDSEIHIGNYGVLLAERDVQIAKLNQAVAERDGQIVHLNNVVTQQDEKITSIYRSNSWRLTRPLRVLRRLVRRNPGFSPWRLIRNIYVAVRREVSRHGLIGFFCGVPYYLRHFRTLVPLLASRPPDAYSELFHKEPLVPHDIRLHPDLSGIGEPVDALISIVIPTLNAGPEFPWLLRKLCTQRGLRALEIVIVDSGSHDGTVEIARAAGCNVVEIPPSDFSHSYARNTGAEAARGDYFLFMVQDAYPIGDYWAYGILRYLLEHADEKLAAASCAEYSRSDSDIMYDSMINTHYRFLGCLDYDRLGEYQGDDHMSLRSFGQLSDVACLIARETFARYRYRGDYAEDLDLGIRLIKDGYRVAMLASVKVVHSHDRPAYYYLKRSFVDVKFLVGMFDDFVYPHIESSRGLIGGIVSLAAHLTNWVAGLNKLDTGRLLHDDLSGWIHTWRRSFVELRLDKRSRLGDAPLDAYIDSLADRYLTLTDEVLDGDARHEMMRFLDAFLARLEHFNAFAGVAYGEQDATLRNGLCDAVLKTFAATAGSALGFMCIDLAQAVGGEGDMAKTISNELKVGI